MCIWMYIWMHIWMYICGYMYIYMVEFFCGNTSAVFVWHLTKYVTAERLKLGPSMMVMLLQHLHALDVIHSKRMNEFKLVFIIMKLIFKYATGDYYYNIHDCYCYCGTYHHYKIIKLMLSVCDASTYLVLIFFLFIFLADYHDLDERPDLASVFSP